MGRGPAFASRSIILRNARIFSDGFSEKYRNVSIIDGRIDDIWDSGSSHQRPRGMEEDIDLNGSYLMPSFIDAHMHFMQWSIMRNALDLARSSTLKDIKSGIEDIIQGKAQNGFYLGSQKILCCNFDESKIRSNDGSKVTRHFLDSISEDVPITIVRVCGHKVIMNTVALEDIPEDIEATDDGILIEEDAMKVSWGPSIEKDQLKGILDCGLEHLHSLGVTGGVEILPLSRYSEFKEAFSSNDPGLDLNYSLDLDTSGVRIKGRSPSSWDDGSKGTLHEPMFMKLFMDGSIGARTASFNQDYIDHEAVDPLLTPEQLHRKVELSNELGLVPMVHAIGDKAVAKTVKVLESVDGIYRIEHFESFSKQTALKISFEKGAVCVQPNFMDIWGRSGGLYSMALGKIFRTLNRFGDLKRDGISFSFGTDMMPPGPLSSMKGCLDHPDPIQNLTLESSINGFTRYSRYHSFLQGTTGLGDVVSGQRADLVVLDRKFAKVLATIRKGILVYNHPNLIN